MFEFGKSLARRTLHAGWGFTGDIASVRELRRALWQHTFPAVIVLDLSGVRSLGAAGPGAIADVRCDVAPAYEHGGGPRHVQLWRGVAPCGVRIEVADRNGGQPTVGDSRNHGERGRG